MDLDTGDEDIYREREERGEREKGNYIFRNVYPRGLYML